MRSELRDISGWIYTDMWSYCREYPGADISELPQPDFLPAHHQVFLQKFNIGGQTGTYIETKAHVDRNATPVSNVPLSDLFLPVVVVDVGRKGPLEKIVLSDVQQAAGQIQPGDALLLYSGWDENWDNANYVEESPYIEHDAALWMIDSGISLLASDFPRFDYPPALQFPWKVFWDKVDFLLAPITNLSGLEGRCGTLIAFPLKIRGACSTPCRAAILMDSDAKSVDLERVRECDA